MLLCSYRLYEEAQMTIPCGHNFCRSCLSRCIDATQQKCPYCRCHITTSVDNLSVANIIKKLQCMCSTKECVWKGTVEDAATHDCQYETVSCKWVGCYERPMKKNYDEHIKNCKHRIINCDDCNMSLKHALMDRHKEHCTNRKIKCPLKCGRQLPW